MRLILLAALLAACTPKEHEPVEDADLDGSPAALDCDDSDPAVHPGAPEVCNGVDDDCDGRIDGGAIDAVRWYDDGDGDGFGDPNTGEVSCQPAAGQVAVGEDCDDSDSRFNPDAVEDDCTDPNDYNCDGITPYDDQDEDGWPACEDCDDSDATTYPGADEYCDGHDDDCDGEVDEDDAVDTTTWYADADSDGFGDAQTLLVQCYQPAGYISGDATDCDDTEASTYPGALEYCDGHDDDCDGEVDEDDAVDALTWNADDDGDGFGDPDDELVQCYQPAGYVEDEDTDCDDTDADTNPGALEYCDGHDDDCDGDIDEDDAVDAQTWYLDDDGDSYGDPDVSDVDCHAPTGYASDNTDCDDTDADVNPGETETCDGTDNDCSGDETGVVTFTDTSSTSTDLSTQLGAGSASSATTISLSSDGTLAICDGTYYVNLEFDGDALTITAPYGSADTILDGSADGPVLALDGDEAVVSIADVTLQDGAGLSGGCIGSQDTGLSLTLDAVVLTDCAATTGGGMYLAGGDLSASDCTIEANEASSEGGGVYIGGQGGGTYAFSACDISTNTAGDSGGGIYAFYGTVQLSDLTVDSNVASGTDTGHGGGGIFADYADVDLDTVDMDSNTTARDGAAAYMDSGTLTVTDSTIHDNDADDDGGAFSVYDGSLAVTTSTINDNTAGDDGGALYTSGGASISLTDSLVQGNTAQELGGGAYVRDGSLDCSGSTSVNAGFWTNTANGTSTSSTQLGGGVYLNWSSNGASEPSLVSDSCDWGTGSTNDNDPDDVVAERFSGNKIRYSSYGDDVDFVCDTTSCAAP